MDILLSSANSTKFFQYWKSFLLWLKVRILGHDLGLPAEFTQRHPFPGPGLAIRIICQEEAYMEKDFPETQVLCRLVVNYSDMVAKVRLFFWRISRAGLRTS